MSLRASLIAASIALAFGALTPAAALAQSVNGEPLRLENAKRDAAASFKAAAVAPSATLRFQPLAAARIEALQRHNVAEGGKRLQIGIHRDIADEAADALPATLDWTTVTGGRVLRIDVSSPQAAALRVGLDLRQVADGTELRVASATGGTVEFADAAALRSGVDDRNVYWSPVTDGDTQRLELFIPTGTAEFTPVVRSVSHLVSSPLRSMDFAKALGGSGACNIDVACRTSTLGQAFVNAKNSVAHMVFQDGGRSFICTGTLLNDMTPSTQERYFYSAAHCLSRQSQADTLVTFWNYETPTCGVRSAGSNTQVSGGADLLFASVTSDALLLRLRQSPPAGAFFSGWNAATLTAPTPTVAIHHPQGDSKKYSRGMHSGFETNFDLDGQILPSTARSSWSEGTTEGGSSGSGLFVLNGSEYQLRGGLAGGFASCSNVGRSEAAGNIDVYSRFDQVYPSLRQWLGTAIGPTRDYTGAWFFPSEPGWGLTVFNYPSTFFALVFVYDNAGRPAWYRMQNAWTGTDVVTSNLDRPTGGAWSANFNPNAVSYTTVGSATLTFTSESTATLTFNDGTVNRTVTLSKI